MPVRQEFPVPDTVLVPWPWSVMPYQSSSKHTYFKETNEQLTANEDALRKLLDELLNYEPLIRIYAEKIKDSGGPSQDSSPYAKPIKQFSEGISGVHDLLLDYTSKKLSGLHRAWNFCKNWCSTTENSAKIKAYTKNVARAVESLEFSAEVLILEKVDAMLEDQAQTKNKISILLSRLDENADRSVVNPMLNRALSLWHTYRAVFYF